MSTVIQAPRDLMEDVASLHLPQAADERLQELVEWSESISLLRAKALHLLGRKP